MPSQDEIRMHGARHCPGGPDPIPASCFRQKLPSIYSRSNSHDIVAGEAYGSGVLWNTSANINGLADSIFHANDPYDGSGDFYIKEGEVVQIFNEPKIISFEFGVTVSGADIDATPPNYLMLWCFSSGGNFTGTREWIWEGEELATKATQTSPTFRISGLELISPLFFDNYNRNTNQFMGAIVQECGGAAGDQDVTVQNMWSMFTVLTHLGDFEDVHA